jgi:hypothetical protein
MGWLDARRCVIVLLIAGLAACSDDSQDTGSSATVAATGSVIDGYVAQGTIWADLNTNGTLDRSGAGEPFAFTDNQGFFSENPLTGVNYCVEGPARNCLELNEAQLSGDEIELRIAGGLDLATNELFEGTLTLRLTRGDDGAFDLSGANPTPIGTLADSAPSDQLGTILTRIDPQLLSEPTDADFYYRQDFLRFIFEDETANEAERTLFELSLQIQQLINGLAQLLEERYKELGEDSQLPPNAGGPVYGAMADVLLDDSNSFQNLAALLGSQSGLEDVLAKAEDRLIDAYDDEGLTLPTALQDTPLATDTIQRLLDIPSAVDDAMQTIGTPFDQEEALGVARGVDVVRQKIGETIDEGETNFDDADIDEALNQLTNESYLGALGENDVDTAGAAERDFTDGTIDFTDTTSIAEALTIPEDAATFEPLGGKAMTVAIVDEINGETIDGSAALFFQGNPDDSRGELDVCVRYENRDDPDDPASTVSEDPAAPDSLKADAGSWWRSSDRVVVVTAEIAGIEEGLVAKIVGGAGDNTDYRFNYGGELVNWTGDAPTDFDNATVPASDQACDDWFDNRLSGGTP